MAKIYILVRHGIKTAFPFCVLLMLLLVIFRTKEIQYNRSSSYIDTSTSGVVISFTNNTTTPISIKSDNTTNSTILYHHPFKYLITPTKKCALNGAGSDPFLLIIVKSNVRNFDNRQAIRLTWGNISEPSIKVVFVLGYSRFLQEFVKRESLIYNDIIQEDFIDDYYNNTLKTVMSFNWCVTNCPGSKYFFFVDDDYLVNVRRLYFELRNKTRDLSTCIFTGSLWTNVKPIRLKDHKWFVSMENYPHSVFPPYVGGGSMLMSYDCASKIKEAFKVIKPLYIDDVYLGIIAKQLNISLTNDGKFHPAYYIGQIHNLYSIHNFINANKLMEDWISLTKKYNMTL